MKIFVLCVSVCSLLGQPLWASGPGSEVEFIELKATNSKSDSRWGPVLRDIVNHEAPGDSNPYNDLVTKAHETCHGIHSWIRNNLNPTGVKVNGFYVLENRAVVVLEPRMRKSQVGPFVPQSLRGNRYQMYVVGQTAWDDTPLYIWDEWNAYTNGGDAAVDLVEQGLWKYGWRDAVAGQIEFVVYALATAMAVEKLDRDYFYFYRPFREFLAWNIERSMKSFKSGAKMEAFKWDKQDLYYESFLDSGDATALRQFTVGLFGAEWTEKVLGFGAENSPQELDPLRLFAGFLN